MKTPQAKTEPCNQCRGREYLLTNRDGRVAGERCSCFQCESCGGRGFIYLEDERGISSIRECVCAELTRRLNLLNDAGIPGKFAEAQFETFQGISQPQKLALRMARDFVADFGEASQGLLFMGQPGVGKTHLAVAIVKALILEKGIGGRFVDFFQLLSDIRHGYSQDLSEQAIINPYVNAPVLVVDELAKGRNTEWELTMLDQIISNRYNSANKITLFTTNYSDDPGTHEGASANTHHVDTRDSRKSWGGEETLQEKVGDRIYSRLKEMCRFVKIDGEDYRKHMLADRPARRKSRE